MPYNQINPNWAPTSAGFGDLNFGMKSLMFDCEMLQVAFQFRTYMPTGTSMDNLGTGHISLDPSILASLKLTPTTYLQGQIGNFIPIGFGGSNGNHRHSARRRRALLVREHEPGLVVLHPQQPVDRHPRNGRVVVREQRLYRRGQIGWHAQ